MAKLFMDVDIVRTRQEELTLITDFNNLDVPTNGREDTTTIAKHFKLNGGQNVILHQTIGDNVGNHVRILLEGENMSIIKLREIESLYTLNSSKTKVRFDERARTKRNEPDFHTNCFEGE